MFLVSVALNITSVFTFALGGEVVRVFSFIVSSLLASLLAEQLALLPPFCPSQTQVSVLP